ncbi:MAG: hypothetical protein JWM61_3061, partial [Micrococcaceae bacterium]|nr:hypothetical protein [Micrococcaceae bacterium]
MLPVLWVGGVALVLAVWAAVVVGAPSAMAFWQGTGSGAVTVTTGTLAAPKTVTVPGTATTANVPV